MHEIFSVEFGVPPEKEKVIPVKKKKIVTRDALIKYIKKNDSFYSDVHFVGYTIEELLEVKTKVEAKISAKRK